jgi:hypothetical protein
MAWVVGIVLFIGLLAVFPAFRAVAGILLVVAVVAGFWLYNTQQRREQQTRSLIPVSAVELRDLTLARNSSSYRLQGTIKNNSDYSLSSLTMKITIYDCPSAEVTPACEIIGEAHPWVLASVPARQIRALEEYVSFPNLPTVQGQFVWSYLVTGTRA